MEKIIVFHPGALGDLLLTLPFLYSFKKNNHKISLYTQSWLTDLKRVFKFIDEWGSIDSHNLHMLFKNDFSPDSLPLSKECSKVIAFFKTDNELLVRNLEKLQRPFVCKSFIPPENFNSHIFLYLKDMLGVEPLSLPRENVLEKRKQIIIHPGSGNILKNWGIENFINLAKKIKFLGEHVLFLLGPAEKHLKNTVLSAGFDILMEVNLSRIYKLLQTSRLFIGNDSGITHLAHIAGTRTIAIFGPTDPCVWRPPGENVIVIYTRHHCSPCIKRNNIVECQNKSCMPDYKTVESATLRIIGKE